MSNDILLLAGKKKKSELVQDITYLSQLAATQDIQLDNLKKEILKKTAEIEHLKKLLEAMVPPLIKIELQPEEIVAESQLRRLRDMAQGRDLTLEEARKFEIFSKIKQSVEKTRPIIPHWTALPESTPNRDLIKIAETSTYKEKIEDDSSDE
jgi:hypothetical protein